MEQVRVDLFHLGQVLDVPHIEAVVVVEGAQNKVVLIVADGDAVGVLDVRIVDAGDDVRGVQALGDVNA